MEGFLGSYFYRRRYSDINILTDILRSDYNY
jgi:hypothetical protein